jgi:hypothetical protein
MNGARSGRGEGRKGRMSNDEEKARGGYMIDAVEEVLDWTRSILFICNWREGNRDRGKGRVKRRERGNGEKERKKKGKTTKELARRHLSETSFLFLRLFPPSCSCLLTPSSSSSPVS